MTNSVNEAKVREGQWAQPVATLHVGDVAARATKVTVEGKHLMGPLNGFGQMWEKTVRLPMRGAQIPPADVVKVWREQFGHFWPKGNTVYGSVSCGLAPGEVAVLHMAEIGGRPLVSTGVYVIYADEESFSFMTPEGHPFAAVITFSAFREEAYTVAQMQTVLRASDPIYEIAMRFGLSRFEDHFWFQVLRNVGTYFGVQGDVDTQVVLLDPRVQWRYAQNIWQNAGMRTALYTVTGPLRWMRARAA